MTLWQSPNSGALTRGDLEPAPQGIDHQGREHFALLGDDDERPTRLDDLFEKRQQGL